VFEIENVDLTTVRVPHPHTAHRKQQRYIRVWNNSQRTLYFELESQLNPSFCNPPTSLYRLLHGDSYTLAIAPLDNSNTNRGDILISNALKEGNGGDPEMIVEC
jgi:hypothetical protein